VGGSVGGLHSFVDLKAAMLVYSSVVGAFVCTFVGGFVGTFVGSLVGGFVGTFLG
jgi:enoyl reductase-like protein